MEPETLNIVKESLTGGLDAATQGLLDQLNARHGGTPPSDGADGSPTGEQVAPASEPSDAGAATTEPDPIESTEETITEETTEETTTEAPAPVVETEEQTTESTEAPAEETAEVPTTGYTWTEGDQSQHYTDADVQQGLSVLGWARNLPAGVPEAFGAIESGQAIAVPRAEYEQFAAWQNQQREQQAVNQQQAQYAHLGLDPEQQAAFDQLLNQQNQLVQQQQQLAQQQQQSLANANLDGTLDRANQAMDAYGASHGLTTQQLDQLVTAAVQNNSVNHFAEMLAERNPVTGQVISPGDINQIFERAFDFTLNQLGYQPQQQLQQQPPVAAPDVAAAPDAQGVATATKKARSASLASAPAADVKPAKPNVGAMSQPEMVQDMVRYLQTKNN